MVKPADRRAAKYFAKFDGTAIGLRFTAVKDIATTAQEIQAGAMVQMEEVTKAYLEGQAAVTSATQIPNYLAFARQIYGKQRKYGGAILANTVLMQAKTWNQRDGLDGAVLKGVAALFGVVITAPTY